MDPISAIIAKLVESLVTVVVTVVVEEIRRDGTAVQAHRDPDFQRRVGARIDEWLRGQGGVGGRDGADPTG